MRICSITLLHHSVLGWTHRDARNMSKTRVNSCVQCTCAHYFCRLFTDTCTNTDAHNSQNIVFNMTMLDVYKIWWCINMKMVTNTASHCRLMVRWLCCSQQLFFAHSTKFPMNSYFHVKFNSWNENVVRETHSRFVWCCEHWNFAQCLVKYVFIAPHWSKIGIFFFVFHGKFSGKFSSLNSGTSIHWKSTDKRRKFEICLVRNFPSEN